MKRRVIWDMDDVIWNLNPKAAKLARVDLAKLTTFSIYENPNITPEERERVLAAYTSRELYEDIVFNDQIVWYINFIYHNFPEYLVEIVSNCATQDAYDLKMEQVLKVIDLPEEQIHLNRIEITTGSTSKTLPENVFVLVDDSPHNIVLGDAVHRIMPAKGWNDVLINSRFNGLWIDRPETDHELTNMVTHYLMEG